MAVGGDVTFYSKPAILDRIYGDNPVLWKIFFRVGPAKMDMSAQNAWQHALVSTTGVSGWVQD